jgi:hypothetical protein
MALNPCSQCLTKINEPPAIKLEESVHKDPIFGLKDTYMRYGEGPFYIDCRKVKGEKATNSNCIIPL